jgi:tRNA1(Val) A37 N6-methylase TrmN6
MFPPRPTELLHTLLAQTIQPGDTVIDATAGNGHDTLFLAQAVGSGGHVIATDIQQAAIQSTQNHLSANKLLDRVELHRTSHQHLATLAPQNSISTIVFNLGYLPGSDHSIKTSTTSTLQALETSITLLKPNGTLAVICYPGHPGGDSESLETESFLSNQPSLRIAKYSILSTKNPAPFLLIATKS